MLMRGYITSATVLYATSAISLNYILTCNATKAPDIIST
jgi:hypothetical protein